MPEPDAGPRLPTTDLRRRVVVIGLLASLATAGVVTVAIALTVGPLLHKGVQATLISTAERAAALDGTVPSDELIRTLSMTPGVSVTLAQAGSGTVSVAASGIVGEGLIPVEGTQPPAAVLVDPSAQPMEQLTTARDSLVWTGALPVTGDLLTLTSSTSVIGSVGTQALQIAIPVGLGVLLLTGLGLSHAVRRALRPLDDMTDLALAIAEGDRGRRLSPDRTTTELGRAAAAFDVMLDSLEHSVERAERAEADMRQLCADVSHELRSPIATIVASADTIVRVAPDTVDTEALAVQMVRDATRASRIVEDLMLVTRWASPDSGASTLLTEPLDIRPLARHCVERVQFLDSVAVTLDETGAHGQSCTVIADEQRTEQVLVNLIDNACRWATTSVALTVHTTETEVVVDVSDDGPGVPADDRERIFERLVRLQPDRARTSGGAGLGLTISRQVATAQGGTLTCLDRPSGATFRLTLPRTTTIPIDSGNSRRNPERVDGRVRSTF